MPAYAPELVGSLGPATADRLQQVGAPYQPGDTIGVSGIQLLQQRRLAGTPTVRVVAQDESGESTEELRSWPGQEPQKVQTTLDPGYQRRADNALRNLRLPASMVAVRPSTGEVLAVSNHGTDGRNLAFEGHYPPGLTFGIVSALSLFSQGGMKQSTETTCPASVTVGGKTFTNQARPDGSFANHFAASCKTTLAQLSSKVDAQALLREASTLGIGKNWNLGVPAFTGSVPVPANDGDKAAAMVGEGAVQVSPLAMAMVAAAAYSGTWRPPTSSRSRPRPPRRRRPRAPVRVHLEPQEDPGPHRVPRQRPRRPRLRRRRRPRHLHRGRPREDRLLVRRLQRRPRLRHRRRGRRQHPAIAARFLGG